MEQKAGNLVNGPGPARRAAARSPRALGVCPGARYSRITSYNVCYTKLLRTSTLLQSFLLTAGLLLVGTSVVHAHNGYSYNFV